MENENGRQKRKLTPTERRDNALLLIVGLPLSLLLWVAAFLPAWQIVRRVAHWLAF